MRKLLILIVVVAIIFGVYYKIDSAKKLEDKINEVTDKVEKKASDASFNTFKQYVNLIIGNAENNYMFSEINNEDVSDCLKDSSMTNEFEYCKAKFDENGKATVEIKGKNGSRFKNYYCKNATRTDLSSCEKIK